jgi:uncharacterized protein YndB with AHSA1/START domain
MIHPPSQQPSGLDQLIIKAEFPNITPELLFDYFVRPGLLTRWFSQRAELHARNGGTLHFAWDDMHLHLRGQFIEVDRGEHLSFTWKWDHEGKRTPRTVRMTFQPAHDGARLIITHASYTLHEQDDRKNHLEAWMFYLTNLQKLTVSDQQQQAV